MEAPNQIPPQQVPPPPPANEPPLPDPKSTSGHTILYMLIAGVVALLVLLGGGLYFMQLRNQATVNLATEQPFIVQSPTPASGKKLTAEQLERLEKGLVSQDPEVYKSVLSAGIRNQPEVSTVILPPNSVLTVNPDSFFSISEGVGDLEGEVTGSAAAGKYKIQVVQESDASGKVDWCVIMTQKIE